MMKLQDVLLKAMAKKITWWEAAEIIGVTDRTMRRWRERLEEHGYSGLADRRKNKPSGKRVPHRLQRRRTGEHAIRWHVAPGDAAQRPDRRHGDGKRESGRAQHWRLRRLGAVHAYGHHGELGGSAGNAH